MSSGYFTCLNLEEKNKLGSMFQCMPMVDHWRFRLISFTVSNSSRQTTDSQAMGCIHVARRFGGRIPTLQAR